MPCGSDVVRREGRRGVIEDSGDGLVAGDSSSSIESGDIRPVAKSIDSTASSGARGACVDGEVMVVAKKLLVWHEKNEVQNRSGSLDYCDRRETMSA